MIAQCPLTTAVDFTATDCHGTEVHLFDILDGGQYVLIDFFFTTCGPCQQATPKVVESYYAFGCNMHDVFYVEISDRDSDAACQNWTNTYGVEYPTIGGQAGGGTICNQYQIGAFPTLILVAPNHDIVIQDLWPINNAQTIITALENHGIQQHDCILAAGENIDKKVTLYPNPADDMLIINGENLGCVVVFNAIGQKVAKFTADSELIIATSAYENGVYFVKIGANTQRFVVTH